MRKVALLVGIFMSMASLQALDKAQLLELAYNYFDYIKVIEWYGPEDYPLDFHIDGIHRGGFVGIGIKDGVEYKVLFSAFDITPRQGEHALKQFEEHYRNKGLKVTREDGLAVVVGVAEDTIAVGVGLGVLTDKDMMLYIMIPDEPLK